MFKKVPGNANYVISLEGELKRADGRECTPNYQDGKISITLFRERRWVDPVWLGRLAHYEISFPGLDLRRYWTITFKEMNQQLLRSVSKVVPIFKEPVYALPGFRIVPTHTHLCVSSEGEVKERNYSGQWSSLQPTVSNGYWIVESYDPDYSKSRSLLLHRLVAFAWVENPEPELRGLVNHINGDKGDTRSCNLEWCNAWENNHHAIRTGLRTDTIPCALRDVLEEHVYTFSSIGDATTWLDMDRTNLRSLTGVQAHKLIKGRYELRVMGDERPWTPTEVLLGSKKGKYVTTLTFADGTTKQYNDTRDIIKEYKLWNLPSWSITCIQERLLSVRPDIVMSWDSLFKEGPYQALRVSDRAVFEADTVRELAEICGTGKTAVTTGLRTGRVSQSGHLFRTKSDEPWPVEIEAHSSRSKCILATHPTESEMLFPSLRSAAAHFGKDKDVISTRLKSGNPLNGWTFKETLYI